MRSRVISSFFVLVPFTLQSTPHLLPPSSHNPKFLMASNSNILISPNLIQEENHLHISMINLLWFPFRISTINLKDLASIADMHCSLSATFMMLEVRSWLLKVKLHKLDCRDLKRFYSQTVYRRGVAAFEYLYNI